MKDNKYNPSMITGTSFTMILKKHALLKKRNTTDIALRFIP
jgi:hypothetical protein